MPEPDPPTTTAVTRALGVAAVVTVVAVVVASAVLAWLAFAVAPGHLNSIGFASRNRLPNPMLYRLHQGLGVLALANAAVALAALAARRRALRILAVAAVVPLAVADAVLYLASW